MGQREREREKERERKSFFLVFKKLVHKKNNLYVPAMWDSLILYDFCRLLDLKKTIKNY
jgi:hypothetical protein